MTVSLVCESGERGSPKILFPRHSPDLRRLAILFTASSDLSTAEWPIITTEFQDEGFFII